MADDRAQVSAEVCPFCGDRHPQSAAFCPFTGNSLVPPADPWIGAEVDAYTIESELGRGAHGVVYAAHDHLGAPIALKLLRTDSAREQERALRRFEREVRATFSIRHRNVVSVLAAGTLPDSTPWLAIERVYGESLRERLEREGRLAIDDAVAIASGVLAGLEAAHAAGIVHRDVKPENILLARVGDDLVPKLVDFGLARDGGPSITAPGSVVGTPRYIAPEQARGRRDIDARVDLWAAGVVLYEMLTGARPYDRPDVLSTVLAILTTTPPGPRALRPEIPDALERCVLHAMQREPAYRVGTAHEMRAALRAVPSVASGAITLDRAAPSGDRDITIEQAAASDDRETALGHRDTMVDVAEHSRARKLAPR